MTRNGLLLLVLVTATSALLSACENVKPFQKGLLAEPGMLVDPNPTLSAGDDHIYFSREASKGGRGFGGGGCGCN